MDLSTMTPDDLWPAWCRVDCLQQLGRMTPDEAERWKHGIFALMVFWDLEPDDLIGPWVTDVDCGNGEQRTH